MRGRRYRIGVHDGFVGIWELRSGEQVGTFMEDAFSAAWARYLELEQSRSLNGFMLRTRDFLAHRWYAIVVVVLGALTVAYLRTEDPSLSPTGAGVRVQEAPRAVQPIADLGSSLAGTLDPSLAARPSPVRSAEEGHGREQQKKDRGAGKDGPAGGGATAASFIPVGRHNRSWYVRRDVRRVLERGHRRLNRERRRGWRRWRRNGASAGAGGSPDECPTPAPPGAVDSCHAHAGPEASRIGAAAAQCAADPLRPS